MLLGAAKTIETLLVSPFFCTDKISVHSGNLASITEMDFVKSIINSVVATVFLIVIPPKEYHTSEAMPSEMSNGINKNLPSDLKL